MDKPRSILHLLIWILLIMVFFTFSCTPQQSSRITMTQLWWVPVAISLIPLVALLIYELIQPRKR